MNDPRNGCGALSHREGSGAGSVSIDSMRILDSCRDKDCFEDIQVFLTDFGEEIICRAGSIRVRSTEVVCCNILTDPVQFNRGFYQVTVRFYVKVVLEACVCGGKSQEIEGVCVCEKKVVLYGAEGSVRVFRSESGEQSFCGCRKDPEEGSGAPTVVVETVDPIALSCKIKENCACNCACPCCLAEELPERVCGCVNGPLCDPREGGKHLYITLGFFSVIRMERPGQFIVTAADYCVPDKECVCGEEEDPCRVFERMAFPVSEFCPPALSGAPCGCK